MTVKQKSQIKSVIALFSPIQILEMRQSTEPALTTSNQY